MELEKKVLHLIENDAKLSPKTIAVMLDEDEEKIIQIIEQLEKQNTILGYSTIVNWETMGNDGVMAMIEVKVTPEREVGFNAIAERIARFSEVKSLYLMSGTYDLAIFVSGKTMQEISWFISHKLSTIDKVQSTASHFVLKRYKQEGFSFEEPQQDKRLVVSP